MRQSIVIACGFFPLPVKTRGALLRSNKSQGVGIRVMDCILLRMRPVERGRRSPHPRGLWFELPSGGRTVSEATTGSGGCQVESTAYNKHVTSNI